MLLSSLNQDGVQNGRLFEYEYGITLADFVISLIGPIVIIILTLKIEQKALAYVSSKS